jgi:sugar phosphate isomerase/epimerase
MQIGAMNHPAHDVLDEIRWMAELGLEFVDLTIEPPAAASWRLDAPAVRRELERHGMGVVGHTAYYLPFASAFDTVRRGAVDELRRCLDLFAEVGASWMNLHPDRHAPHARSGLLHSPQSRVSPRTTGARRSCRCRINDREPAWRLQYRLAARRAA